MNPYRKEPEMSKSEQKSPSWFAAYKFDFYKLLLVFLFAFPGIASTGLGVWAIEKNIGWLAWIAILFAILMGIVAVAAAIKLFDQ